MAFFLTPRFAPAYQQCGPFSGIPVSRPSYRQVSRPRASFPTFAPFLNQLDELFTEIDRRAQHEQRQQHEQQQQRKRAFCARFDVRENNEGYQVEGEVPGFEQEHISIEVTDEHTLKVAGDSEWKAAQAQPNATESADKMDGVTLNEPEAATEVERPVSPTGSDTGSHKSYQATVEDDFEDLGAETSSTVSTASEPREPRESKGKEKVVDETTVTKQPQPEVPVQQQRQEHESRQWLNERVHGSFERSFQFSERIDAANVRANLRNGVLSIYVPKAPAPQIKRIVIQ
jgi:HSP20 family molecular chaperone IbpA